MDRLDSRGQSCKVYHMPFAINKAKVIKEIPLPFLSASIKKMSPFQSKLARSVVLTFREAILPQQYSFLFGATDNWEENEGKKNGKNTPHSRTCTHSYTTLIGSTNWKIDIERLFVCACVSAQSTVLQLINSQTVSWICGLRGKYPASMACPHPDTQSSFRSVMEQEVDLMIKIWVVE